MLIIIQDEKTIGKHKVNVIVFGDQFFSFILLYFIVFKNGGT